VVGKFPGFAWVLRHPLSIRGQLVALSVVLFVAFIWALVFFSATVLQNRFMEVLAEQQFASARHVAAELDDKLRERVEGLQRAARHLPADLRSPALDAYLAQQSNLQAWFAAGITVIGLDGRTIADFPIAPGRRGTYYGDRDYFRQVAATGKAYIDKPILGRALKRPVLTIGVPVLDGAGKVRAVMTGITDLTALNFLGFVTDRTITGQSEFLVLSRQERVIVAATDRTRVLASLGSRGANPAFDRFVDGFEGSWPGTDADGVSKLFSGKAVPTADWIIVAALPTAVAFGPVTAMQDYLHGLAALMTLLAIFIAHWMARRVLKPLEDASRAMGRMTAGDEPLAPLPARRRDEVGLLIDSFNRLVAGRQRYEAALAENEQRFRSLVEGAPDAIFVQIGERFAYVNQMALRLFRAESKEQLLGVPCLSRLHPDSREAVQEHIRLANGDRGNPPPLVERYLRLDGAEVDVEISAVPCRYQDEDGALVFVRDISERKEQQARIARLVRIYAVLSGINSAIVRIHERQALVDEACRVAVEEGQFGMAWIGLLNPDGQTLHPVAGCGIDLESIKDIPVSIGTEAPSGQGTAHEALSSRRAVYCNDITTVPQVGPVRAQALKYGYSSVCALPLVVDEKGIGVMGLYAREKGAFDAEEMKLLDELAADISFALQYIQREERLSYLAYYDALTGLPIRNLFLDRLTQFMHGVKNGSHSVAVILFDLDHFTHLNETAGRHVGDAVLREVAQRLRNCVWEPCSLARIGADTFAVAVDDLGHGTEAAALVQERIFEALNQPCALVGGEIRLTAHAGIALYPGDGEDGEALLHGAETALREARDSGIRCLYYAPEINARTAANLALERDLQTALEAGQFVLHFQPRVDLRSGKVVGAEALIRWLHPQRGLVSPADFIPVAEETGLIVPMGSWVVDQVCAHQVAWLAAGLDIVPVAVNLSPAQFAEGDLLPTLTGALARHGLAAEYLELELTESLVMQNPDQAAETMMKARKCGLRLALDDFGTGYSSLAYLQRFPFDFVKIDRAFVRDINENPGNAAIATAVIAMAHRLNLRVVAEGVETEGQLHYLRQHGCDQIQGFLFSRPVPAEGFAELLHSGKCLRFDVIQPLAPVMA